MFYKVEEVIEELKKGKVVIVCDDEDWENEGDFIVLVEKMMFEVINFMVIYGRGLICIFVNEEIVYKLNFYLMVVNNMDVYGIVFIVSIDYILSIIGISVYECFVIVMVFVNEVMVVSDF